MSPSLSASPFKAFIIWTKKGNSRLGTEVMMVSLSAARAPAMPARPGPPPATHTAAFAVRGGSWASPRLLGRAPARTVEIVGRGCESTADAPSASVRRASGFVNSTPTDGPRFGPACMEAMSIHPARTFEEAIDCRPAAGMPAPCRAILPFPDTPMTRKHAFKMQLKPGAAEEYRRRHDAIWPELASLLTEVASPTIRSISTRRRARSSRSSAWPPASEPPSCRSTR